jgi:hypothetical protein
MIGAAIRGPGFWEQYQMMYCNRSFRECFQSLAERNFSDSNNDCHLDHRVAVVIEREIRCLSIFAFRLCIATLA